MISFVTYIALETLNAIQRPGQPQKLSLPAGISRPATRNLIHGYLGPHMSPPLFPKRHLDPFSRFLRTVKERKGRVFI